MADDSNQRETSAQPRVYKASQVHKRRPGKTPAVNSAEKLEEKPVEKAPEIPAEKPKPAEKSEAAPEPQAASSAEPTSEPESKPKSERKSTAKPTAKPRRKRSLALRIALIVIGVFVAALLVCVGFLSADRWMLRSDKTLLLGEWFLEDSPASIVITDELISLNAETRYEYTVDETAKTITYRFGDLEGQGHYWFTPDRKRLVIQDGKDFTPWGTAIQDWTRQIANFFEDTFGSGATLPSGDGVIVLSRTATVTTPSASAASSDQGASSETEPSSGQAASSDTASSSEAAASSESAASSAAATEGGQ